MNLFICFFLYFVRVRVRIEMNLIWGKSHRYRKDQRIPRMIETDYYRRENTNIAVCGVRVRQFARGSSREKLYSRDYRDYPETESLSTILH